LDIITFSTSLEAFYSCIYSCIALILNLVLQQYGRSTKFSSKVDLQLY
jgi:hypothetical protein